MGSAALIGGVFGIALGISFERSHFCSMGAVADVVLFGSWRRARAWLAAVAAAAVLVTVAVAAGVAEPTAAPWQTLTLPAAIAGGLAFGVGMVLAGGCGARLVVRAASGQAKALAALVVLLAIAAAVPVGLANVTGEVPDMALGTLPSWATLPAAAGALLALAWLLADRKLWAMQVIPTPALIALAVGAGATTTAYSGQPGALVYVPLGGAAGSTFASAIVVGTAVGAAASAALAGRWRLQTLGPSDDVGRHLVGGSLMGVGAGLVGGGTLGAGVSGIASLALGPFVALLSMVVGAVVALRLLSGDGLPSLRRLTRSRRLAR
ncbi:MAG: YeeE/YedE thiosulfate transporter family protein [Pseudomonadota bacterium]